MLPSVQKTILNPAATRALVPHLASTRNPNVWVYRYTHPNGWRLSIATHAEPGSDKLSLGGFRIAPEERTSVSGFDSDVEAIELAIGMEEKVHWSRTLRVGGPLARRDMRRIVGGKCVLHPSADARMGRPRDRDLLDFAIACLTDCDITAGIRITTGQDLGHGLMSDGRTHSLDYLHRGFRGSVVADTSKPTGEGNYHVLCGMLRAFDVRLRDATVGLIGAGNIGMHVIDCLRKHNTKMLVVEMQPERRALLAERALAAQPPEEKVRFLAEPMDALVLNASGGSLDIDSVRTSSANSRLKVICGSENLVMPNPTDAEAFRRARKVYCPTELGGMMGYLTAVEQYLAQLEGVSFDVETLFEAAGDLETPAYDATKYIRDHDFAVDFQQAIDAIYS
jgi:hypothetical protein